MVESSSFGTFSKRNGTGNKFSFFLISFLFHVVLLGLLLFSAYRDNVVPLSLETEVVFEREQEGKGVAGGKKVRRATKKQITKTSTAETGGLHKAPVRKKESPKREEEPEISGADVGVSADSDSRKITGSVGEGDGSGLRTFSRNWKAKREQKAYRSSLAKIVSANWMIPLVSPKEFEILVETIIDRRGNMVRMKVIRSSGLAVLDSAAERAVRVSVPFPEFPESFGRSKRSFRAVFRFTPDKVED